ncbi:hypothetical protein [Streptomyces sp. NPDC047028]|uniref:hypothetical protein n=1 Tax=Streptomyces sp. NPDC047028 TaxID=3155793 RepID=UPI0033C37E6C
MELQKSPSPQQPPEGCLVVALRIPLRVLTFLVVLPVRLAWDALGVVLEFLWRYLIAPLGRLAGWVLHGLYRYLLAPLGRALVRLYVHVLTPVGHALRWLLAPVGRALVWLGGLLACGLRAVLRGIGTALYWIGRVLLVLPALALWRWVLEPVWRVVAVVAREIGAALGHAWRVAGRVARAVGRVVGTLFRWIFVEPARWAYRTVLTPVGHVVRDLVLRPVAGAARAAGRATRQVSAAVRESARQARADLGRTLFGTPRKPEPVGRREPTGPQARTLERSTTPLTKD